MIHRGRTGGQAIARKRREDTPAPPTEARGVVIALTVAEVAMALLVAWALVGSNVPRHASLSAHMQAADAFILATLLACLGLMVFVLALWQWRLGGSDRVRILVAGHVSLLLAFCGLCWYDVTEATVRAGGGQPTLTPLRQVIEQTAASSLTLAALLAGLLAFLAVLWSARRSLKQAAAGGIVAGDSHDSSHVKGIAK